MTTRPDSRWIAMIGLAFSIVAANIGFAAAPVKPPVKPQKAEITDDTRQAAEASNGFAFDLYAQLREQDGNLFYSPASISTALAMTYAGAAGETERQMATVLHVDKVDVPAKKVPYFKPGKELKELINKEPAPAVPGASAPPDAMTV